MFEAPGFFRELSLGIALKNPAWEKRFGVGIFPGILSPLHSPRVFSRQGFSQLPRTLPVGSFSNLEKPIFPRFWRKNPSVGLSPGWWEPPARVSFSWKEEFGRNSWGNEGKVGAGMKSCFNSPADAKIPSHIPAVLSHPPFSHQILRPALFLEIFPPIPTNPAFPRSLSG